MDFIFDNKSSLRNRIPKYDLSWIFFIYDLLYLGDKYLGALCN